MGEWLRTGAEIATPIGLVGFSIGAALYAYSAYLKHQQKKLESLPEGKRARAIDQSLKRYGLDASNLTREQKVKLLHDEMDKGYRLRRLFMILSAVVAVVAMLIVTTAFLIKAPAPQAVAIDTGKNDVGKPAVTDPAANSPRARCWISPQAYASCVTGQYPSFVFQKLLEDSSKGMKTELRNWEEMTSFADREELLNFTDRFVACPQQSPSEKGSPGSSMVGMHINLDIARGANSRQLIIQDIILEVVQFHTVAPTFILGAARFAKPVIVLEIENQRSPLPWYFHAKWIGDSPEGPFHDFLGQQVLVKSDLLEGFVLRILASHRGIYEYHIHLVLQQDNSSSVTIRVTDRPLITGFFSKPGQGPDYPFLEDRYKRSGGIMRSKIAFQEWLTGRR